MDIGDIDLEGEESELSSEDDDSDDVDKHIKGKAKEL